MLEAGDLSNFSGQLELAAPGGGVVLGQSYPIGNATQGVALATAAAGVLVLFALSVQSVAVKKATGAGKSFAVGDQINVAANIADVVGGVVTPWIAIAVAAEADAFVEVSQQLHPGPTET